MTPTTTLDPQRPKCVCGHAYSTHATNSRGICDRCGFNVCAQYRAKSLPTRRE